MKTKTRSLSKTTRSNLITYGMVVAAYIIVEIFLRAAFWRDFWFRFACM